MRNRALITGASRGLGLALARALAERRLGADHRRPGRRRPACRRRAPAGPVHAGPATSPTRATAGSARRRRRAGGGLDLLVHNASLLGPSPSRRSPSTRSTSSSASTPPTSSPRCG